MDASGRAMGAALEQSVDGSVLKVEEMLRSVTTKPIAFLYRKLTSGQFKGWDARDKEAYAIVSVLAQWESWIGTNPLKVLTDH